MQNRSIDQVNVSFGFASYQVRVWIEEKNV